jgi:NADH-quinone oxidoreductase subunit G
LVANRPVAYDQAILKIGKGLAAITAADGGDRIALVGGGRSSLETQTLLARLGRQKGWQGPCFGADDASAATARAAIETLTAKNAASMHDLEGADTLVVIGCDPLGEAPMLALALRQAWRQGARIVTIDPRPVKLPFPHDHLALPPHDLATAVRHLIIGALEPSREAALDTEGLAWFDRLKDTTLALPAAETLQALGRRLSVALRPAMVCGTALPVAALPRLVGVLQAVVRPGCIWSGVFFPLPEAGSFGAGRFGAKGTGFEDLVPLMEDGRLKALVVVENDLFSEYPDSGRLRAALANLDLLVVMDYLASELVDRAHIFIPTQTLYEAGGRCLNNEGRLQEARAVITGGRPIVETGGGDHPPRIFEDRIPGDGPQAADAVLNGLMDDGGAGPMVLNGEAKIDRLTAGERLLPEGAAGLPDEIDDAAPSPNGLSLVESAATFGSERLSALSPVLERLTPAPTVTAHPDTAAALGWQAAVDIQIPDADPRLTLRVVLDARTAKDVLVVPRRVGWDRMALRRWAAGLGGG